MQPPTNPNAPELSDELDPELERRSQRNKFWVTIGFITLIVGSLLLAKFTVSVVKPADGAAAKPTVESAGSETN